MQRLNFGRKVYIIIEKSVILEDTNKNSKIKSIEFLNLIQRKLLKSMNV